VKQKYFEKLENYFSLLFTVPISTSHISQQALRLFHVSLFPTEKQMKQFVIEKEKKQEVSPFILVGVTWHDAYISNCFPFFCCHILCTKK